MSKSLVRRTDRLTTLVCTSLFAVFAFVYLYCYQADLLTVMQHVFSKGQTHYNQLVGAIIITVVLVLLQVGVANLCRKARVASGITFVPSALALAMLTDVHFVGGGAFNVGSWSLALPILLVVYALLVWGSFKTKFSEFVAERITSPCRKLWINLAIMFSLMSFVCLSSNGDKAYHARICAEQCLLKDDYDGAIKAIGRCDKPDTCLTMLTAYALSKKGLLADRLFEYPLAGRSSSLLPDSGSVRLEMLPYSTIYMYLGGWFTQKMQPRRYFSFMQRHGMLNSSAIDYMLCSFLLDKDLNAFVDNIGKYYTINDSLPKHYKEALLLYTHLHSVPKLMYNNDVMNADYQDYQKMERSFADGRERKNELRGTYGNTYWFYYQYE